MTRYLFCLELVLSFQDSELERKSPLLNSISKSGEEGSFSLEFLH